MKPSKMQKVFYYAGILATVLIIGCFVAWQLGPEFLWDMHQRFSPLLPYVHVGLGLLVLGLLLVALGREPGTANPVPGPGPGAAPQSKVRCHKCQALNDEHAKFCNQCGAAV
jgi:hypothetical protein